MESPPVISDLKIKEKSPNKAPKRKSPTKIEQNNNKKPKTCASKEEMFEVYQPWVIQTYGDLAKTKTITLKKYTRILRTLRGEELANADNSKFRFWVKAKGFCIGQPQGYEAKPADYIVGRFSVCDRDYGICPASEKAVGSARDPALYIPNITLKNNSAEGPATYRKVAIVENFFDIIYNVHVDLEGRPGKHAGQKRTYRTITETYSFLPREAVTRFLLGCTECQKHSRSPSPPQPAPLPPLLPLTAAPCPTSPDAVSLDQPQKDIGRSQESKVLENSKPTTTPPCSVTRSELRDVRRDFTPPVNDENRNCQFSVNSTPKSKSGGSPLDVSNLIGTKTNKKKSGNHQKHESPKLWCPVKSIEEEQKKLNPKRILLSENIDYSMPITSTYLKYMRSLGCKEDEAFNFDNSHVSQVLNQFMHEAISHYFNY